MGRGRIPLLASVGLVFSCADRGLGDEDGPTSASGGSGGDETGASGPAFFGTWNLVHLRYGSGAYAYGRDFPYVVDNSYYGQNCVSAYAADLEVRTQTEGALVSRYTWECPAYPPYEGAYGEDLEIETIDDATFDVFRNSYIYSDSGYGSFTETGYTGSSSSTTTGGTGGPIPQRELLFRCTLGGRGLTCSSDQVFYEFARPRCSSDAQCGPSQQCWFDQCAAPMTPGGP